MIGLLVGCIALGMRGITRLGLKVDVFECGRCVTVACIYCGQEWIHTIATYGTWLITQNHMCQH